MDFPFFRELFAQKNFAEASKYFKKAADAGLATGLFNYGILYAKGIRMEKDLEKATEYFKRAGYAGNPTVTLEVASGLETEKFGFKDLPLACELYKLLADDEDVDGLLGYSRALHAGWLGEIDNVESYKLLKKAAHQNLPKSVFAIAQAQEFGWFGVPSVPKAIENHKIAGSLGEKVSMVHYAESLANGLIGKSNPAGSLVYLKKCFDRGTAEGAYQYGTALYSGKFKSKDKEKGKSILRTSGVKGHFLGYTATIERILKKKPSKSDYERALKYTEECIAEYWASPNRASYADILSSYAKMLQDPKYATPDLPQSLKFFKLALDHRINVDDKNSFNKLLEQKIMISE